MAQKLDLRKNVFSKIEYPSVINTTFTDLGVTSISQDILTEDNVTKFFEMYNDLFYAIPAEGDINSHEYLARTSGEYIDFDANEEEIEALQQEITELRRQLLDERGSALNTIADVLDTAGLDLPELPTLPDLEIPSEFSVDVNVNVDQGEEQTRREKRQERRAKRKEERQKRRDERRNN